MQRQTGFFVVLDRDDTINVDTHYISDPEGLQLMPNALNGLRYMQELGLNLVIATNQSGIGRGYFGYEDLHRVHYKLRELLVGVDIKGIYFCPHHPAEDCNCRKPETGLFYQAVEDWEFESEDSFVIGDRHSDIEMGNRVGATTIMTNLYYKPNDADYFVYDLLEAAILIGDILEL